MSLASEVTNLMRTAILPSCRHCVCCCVDTVVYQGRCGLVDEGKL